MTLPSPLSGKRAWLMARLVSNGVLQASAAVGGVVLIQQTFDRFVSTPVSVPGASLLWFALGFLGIALGSAGLRMLERVDAERLGQSYVHQLRLILYKHLSKTPARSLQKRSRGSLMLRFLGDLTALRQWISLGLARLVVAGVAVLGALLALAVISWQLALTVGLVLVSGATLSLSLGKSLQQAVREARRRRSSLAGNLGEKLASMAVVQVSGQTRREQNRIDRQSERLKVAMVSRAWIIGGLRAAMTATAAIATAAALIVGSVMVAAGQATPGMVVAAMSITGFLLPSLRDLGRVYEYWHGASVSREKLQQILGTPTQVRGKRRAGLKTVNGRLIFKNVTVNDSLTEFSAVVEPGSVVAIVGPNGAGKSTLLSLVARLVDPERGKILLDGRDLGKIAADSLRRVVGMVSPDLPLLRGTISKNLRYRWRSAPGDELARVCHLCGVDEVLAGLPDGDGTRILEGGTNLSVGQRQRIALARAILGSPPILLLDEADANLDPKTADVLNTIIADYPGTVLLVTHRSDVAARADSVWFMEGGKLLASEEPGELLQADGLAARFFRHRNWQALAS